MKILLWHGYLLGGTGSNVYTRALARAWSRIGHEVVVLCQEPRPQDFDLAGARVVRPELPDTLLPVFVLDRYKGLEPRLLQDLTRTERDRYVEANAAAVRAELPADLVFANHVLLGGPVGAASGARYAVKAHGSELEYALRGNPELQAWGRESLAGAEAVFVGPQPVPARPGGGGGARRARAGGAAGRGRGGFPPAAWWAGARGAAGRGAARPAEPRQRER